MSFENRGPGPREQGAGGAGQDRRPRRPGGRYVPRRKVCLFCVDKVGHVDYKDIGRLGRYVSDRGKIESRRKMGTCAKHQRSLAVALKRARHLALLPYTAGHIRP
ncbi:MAG: 30S ribosomal protein S18 [Chloroflexota bacterium]|nr:30S ribosomal protein S18 [Chloroflexota bacterium]